MGSSKRQVNTLPLSLNNKNRYRVFFLRLAAAKISWMETTVRYFSLSPKGDSVSHLENKRVGAPIRKYLATRTFAARPIHSVDLLTI